ncbi:BH3741 [Halalkalibacterium halodurans C-125]|uniref:BH3741 protein n=1 Tax=Halalkalibacterium halodurans (strain ATCC BAA-125 / DSM 18197 / FERM 7344 / JCM 9153 / C-125) TaxID=272558 RepID=Q9K6I8_HALH5|nr:exonuclease domain-containing protein [Halalkalibacterium halodurans]BAB07460.1 BH3741 [Halalkalibacterium halodurans C-125]
MFWKRKKLPHGLAVDPPLNTPIRQLAFTVFDTETTGFAVGAGDRLIEVAAVHVEGLEVTDFTFQTYVNPERNIPAEIEELTGISEDKVKNAPASLPAIESFFRFVEQSGSAAWVGHYASFDVTVLKKELQRYQFSLNVPLLFDTLDLIGYISPSKDMRDLEVYAKQFGTYIYERHQALGDALTTAHLFCELLRHLEARGKTTLADLIDISSMTNRALLF